MNNIYHDNIIYSLQRVGGGSIYWYELQKRFLQQYPNMVCIEHKGKDENIFRRDLTVPNTIQENKYPLSLLRYMPLQIKLKESSIFHSSYYRYSKQKGVKNIVTVHDFTYEYYRKGLAQKVHTWQKKQAIKHADGIICVSENTKRDLLKFFPFAQNKKIEVIYNGVGDEFYPLQEELNLFSELNSEEYIVFIGSRSSYKNFDVAVKTIEQLSNKSLVIVGGGTLTDQEKETLNNIKYYHYQGITGEELNSLYNFAFCLLYPSSYEGFGIPIAEAMQAGCPVVSTNLSSIPEVAGDAGLLVDNIMTNTFVDAVNQLNNESVRKLQIEKGQQQAKKFSWDKCFKETEAFYQEIGN